MIYGISIDKKRKSTRLAAICVALAALVVSFFAFTTESQAFTKTQGTVMDGPVWVRESPVDGTPLTSEEPGNTVTVLDETEGKDGKKWYQVRTKKDGKNLTGYIRSDFISLEGEQQQELTAEDEAYIQELKAAGFPESYCASLLALHKKYPSWQFTAVLTGLDWADAVAAESAAGKNLVQSTVNDSRKSTDSAAYDWKTNTWYGYDGDGWVCASTEYIAYCMDPRNFLDDTYIFQFETLEYAEYQNKAGVQNILKNTFMSGNYTDTDGKKRSYAQTFLDAGKELLVSPYHLASRCKQEQGKNGTSPLITGSYNSYEGYYNYFNIGAYTTSTASASVNGLMAAKRNGWDSIYKSILGGSKVVADNYVKKGQNTIYFEKFNVVYQNSLYSHQYMTNLMAAISEGSSMGQAYENKEQAFVFRIPVYQNMPETAVTFEDKGNPNNWLKSLKIEGCSLTPSFKPGKTEYSLVVGENVSEINVTAKAVAGTSEVNGTGKYSLKYGDNKIKVTCVSQSGEERVYTITAARQQGGGTSSGADGQITSPYPLGTYMTGIQPGSSAQSVLEAVSAKEGTLKILNADGTENTGTVATGNRLSLEVDGKTVSQYEIVMYGDINGDGKISNADQVLMQKQILGIEVLGGSALEAANVSRDGGVTNKDLVILQKHILNIALIDQ